MSKLTPEGRADALRQAQRICNEMRYGLVTVAVARLAVEQEEELAALSSKYKCRRSEAEDALRALTPGGSEFQTTAECVAYIREQYAELHRVRITRASLRSAAQEMAICLKDAVQDFAIMRMGSRMARWDAALAAWEKVK